MSLLLLIMAQAANPLAGTNPEMLQCYHPDIERRTCRSLARYTPRASGGYDNEAVVLLSGSPKIVMTTVTPVEIDDGAICGAIRQEDLSEARISIDDRSLTGEELDNARARVAGAMAPMAGRRVCTRYIPAANAMRAEVTIDGVHQPAADDRVTWVSPSDGYTVAP